MLSQNEGISFFNVEDCLKSSKIKDGLKFSTPCLTTNATSRKSTKNISQKNRMKSKDILNFLIKNTQQTKKLLSKFIFLQIPVQGDFIIFKTIKIVFASITLLMSTNILV